MTVSSERLAVSSKKTGALMIARSVICLPLTVFLLTITIAQAQQPGKIPRIAYLSSRDRASDSARSEAVRLGLRELGYVEGQNLTIEYRYAQGSRARLPELAAELALLKVDLIVIAGKSRSIPARPDKVIKRLPIRGNSLCEENP
jgi:putative ABC transport system substrate-binding protein